jgi:hypothetical protein
LKIEFDNINHRYKLDGIQVPSVTQILKSAGLTPDFSAIDPLVLQEKARLGTEVHELTQIVDVTGALPEVCTAQALPYLQAYLQFKTDFAFTPWEIELQVASRVFGYAGTLDRLGAINGTLDPYIIDVKTSEDCPYYHGPQLAGYAIGYSEYSEIPLGTLRRAVVQLKPDGKYKFIPYDNLMDYEAFKQARNLYYFKQGRG